MQTTIAQAVINRLMTIYAARAVRSCKGNPYTKRCSSRMMILITITKMKGQILRNNVSITNNLVERILTSDDLTVCNRLIRKILVAVSIRTIVDRLWEDSVTTVVTVFKEIRPVRATSTIGMTVGSLQNQTSSQQLLRRWQTRRLRTNRLTKFWCLRYRGNKI